MKWEELKGKQFSVSVGKTIEEALASTDATEICFTTDGAIVMNGVRFSPTLQNGTSGTSANYVYSNSNDKPHGVLSGTFKAFQNAGKCYIRHKYWGSTGDYADGQYATSEIPYVNTGSNGVFESVMLLRMRNFNLKETNSTTTTVNVNYNIPALGTTATLALSAATTAKAGVMTVDHVNALSQAQTDIAQAQTDISGVTDRLKGIVGNPKFVALADLDSFGDKYGIAKQGWYAIGESGNPLGHMLVTTDPMRHVVYQLVFGNFTIVDNALSVAHTDGKFGILMRHYSIFNADTSKIGTWSEWSSYQNNFIRTEDSDAIGEDWTYGHTKIDNIVSNLDSFAMEQGERSANSVDINYTNPADGTTKSFSLNQVTSAKAGLMGTTHLLHLNQAYGGVTELNKHYKNLGDFQTENEALTKITDVSICGSADVLHAHMTYADGNGKASIILVQSVHGNYCRQVIFNKDKIFQRGITFTDDNRTTISVKEDWGYLLADRLQWSTSGRKYVLSQFGQGFNHGITDPIPLATASVDGLMSKEDKAFLDSLKSKTQSEE